jgi:hypothetical protein
VFIQLFVSVKMEEFASHQILAIVALLLGITVEIAPIVCNFLIPIYHHFIYHSISFIIQFIVTCENVCLHGGICVAPNTCNCSNTSGYYGYTCSSCMFYIFIYVLLFNIISTPNFFFNIYKKTHFYFLFIYKNPLL